MLALEVKKGHTPNDDCQLILVEHFIYRDTEAANILMQLDEKGDDSLCEEAREKIIEYSFIEFVKETLRQNARTLCPRTVLGLTKAFCEGRIGLKEVLKRIYVTSPHGNVDSKEILLLSVKQNDDERYRKEALEIIRYCIEHGQFPVDDVKLQAKLGETWAHELLKLYKTKGLTIG